MDTFTLFAEVIDVGVLRARTVCPGEFKRADSRHARRQQDLRAGVLDRDVPFVAGHVPVEFVVIFEKFQAVADAVMQNDGADGIGCVIDVDLPFQIVPLARGFDFERLPGGIGCALKFHEQACN